MKNEIIYQIDLLKDLTIIPNLGVRWLKIPEDYLLFQEHLAERRRSVLTINEWTEWSNEGMGFTI